MHCKILQTFSLFTAGAVLAVSASVQAASPEAMIESKVKQSIDRDRDGRLNRDEQAYARQLQRSAGVDGV